VTAPTGRAGAKACILVASIRRLLMIRRFACIAGLLLLGGPAGCSSSSSGAGTGANGATDSAASPGVGTDASAGADATAGGGTADDASDDAPPPIADAQADRGATHAEVDASAACASYCACMATNCSQDVFPTGCLDACATQTTWDLSCRATMCTLAPEQPDNDHCTHAFGMKECLDK
jgi:hypothetical protein